MNKRVLFLVEGGDVPHLPGESGYAGFIRYVEGGTSHLLARGFDVIFGTVRSRGPLHDAIEALGCETFALDCRSSWGYPLAALRLSRLIRHHKIDILHLNESIQACVGGFGGLIARRGLRIFHRHHTTIPGPTLVLSRTAGKVCNLTMAVSEAVAREAQKEGVPSEKVRVALNGVRTPRTVTGEEVATLRKKVGAGDGSVVGIVGHLRPEKGHLTLLEAMASVARDRSRHTSLVIVGTGTEEKRVRAAADSLPELNIFFAGHQPDVDPWFSMFDVAVVPSLREPFGLVAAEAMACSRPVIASDVDGLAEIVDPDRTGLLVRPGDAADLARAISKLLDSPSLAAALGRGGHERYLREFTIAAMADRWIECYGHPR